MDLLLILALTDLSRLWTMSSTDFSSPSPWSWVVGPHSPAQFLYFVCAGDPNSAPDVCAVGTLLATVLPPLISFLWKGSRWLLYDYLGRCQIRWLACSPFTQEDELEDDRFQISVGYLQKSCHVYMHAIINNENGVMILKEIFKIQEVLEGGRDRNFVLML